jgi:hypothetical protein
MKRDVLMTVLVLLLGACDGDGSADLASDGGIQGGDAESGSPGEEAGTDDAGRVLDAARTRDAMAADAMAATDGGGASRAAATNPRVYYFEGVYFVPERSEVSSYPVDEAKWVIDGQRVRLAYNLPRMLVGQSERVDMTGTLSADGTSASLSGPLGTATCDIDGDGLLRSCLEQFVGIEVDLERVRRLAAEDDPANVQARVDVSRRFSTDPIGVIEPTDSLLGPVEVARCTRDEDCGRARCDREDDGTGTCEPVAEHLTQGQACAHDFQCADDLECAQDTSTCEAGDDDDAHDDDE